MRNKLHKNLKERISKEVAPQSPLKYLMTTDILDYIDILISIVYLYTRPKKGTGQSIFLTEIISAVGHGVRNKLRLKKDSAIAAKTGAFMLFSFEHMGMIQVVKGGGLNGHCVYLIKLLNDDNIKKLWETVKLENSSKMPSTIPYEPWTSSKHSSGASMVKTGDKELLKSITPEKHPMLFEAINKSQSIGWNINKEIYSITKWALRSKTEAFSDIWEQQNPEAKKTKVRESKAIIDIAGRLLDSEFYHLYYFDFRGRKYPTTAYLHEQGSDLAKGLLLRKDKKPIGNEGYQWLLLSIASNWAGDCGREDKAKTDKIPMMDRYHWASDNEEIFLSYAEKPKVHQGWMQADKPWQFLAGCVELKKLREWQYSKGDFNNYQYESHLECFIDGTNNGSQHLSALTRDERTAPLVNLVPSEFPGDLYKYIADHVWKNILKEKESMSKQTVAECEAFIDQLTNLKKSIFKEEAKSERRAQLLDEIKLLRDSNRSLIKLSCCVWWARVLDAKHKRKIVKRGVMTLPYGGTPYGLGQQVIDDSRKHGIEMLVFSEHKWSSYMGRQIYDTCKVSLKRPMQLLGLFEKAGKAAEAEGRFLSWTSPITNFPVVQHYTEGRVKKIYVQYGPPHGPRKNTGYFENTFQLSICFIEDIIPSKGKQSTGASPNAIHSLDAAHLTLTTCRADFPITTIHDSFGCLLADMPKLYSLVRETFVEIYQTDPLSSLFNDIGGNIENVQVGKLDINDILESEFCFS